MSLEEKASKQEETPMGEMASKQEEKAMEEKESKQEETLEERKEEKDPEQPPKDVDIVMTSRICAFPACQTGRSVFETRYCKGCLTAYYCDEKCQKADRKRHIPECKKVSENALEFVAATRTLEMQIGAKKILVRLAAEKHVNAWWHYTALKHYESMLYTPGLLRLTITKLEIGDIVLSSESMMAELVTQAEYITKETVRKEGGQIYISLMEKYFPLKQFIVQIVIKDEVTQRTVAPTTVITGIDASSDTTTNIKKFLRPEKPDEKLSGKEYRVQFVANIAALAAKHEVEIPFPVKEELRLYVDDNISFFTCIVHKLVVIAVECVPTKAPAGPRKNVSIFSLPVEK